jgi:Leucine-rich repeat (LRR) protein
VSDEAIASLKTELPSLTVHRSYRRTLEAIEKLGGKVTDYPIDGRSKTSIQQPSLTILAPGHFRLARRVDLSGLHLEEDVLRPVMDLPRLETLHLGYNVDDSATARLVSLTNLRHLYLKDTQITDAGLASLTSLTRLRLLSLGRNTSDDGLAKIAPMKSLVYVDLEATQVTDAGLRHLAALPNLEKLNLSGRPISDDGLRQLRGITTLNELHLRGCKDITDDGFLSLREMKNLKSVDLGRTQIGPGCLSQLREALPNCTFKH